MCSAGRRKGRSPAGASSPQFADGGGLQIGENKCRAEDTFDGGAGEERPRSVAANVGILRLSPCARSQYGYRRHLHGMRRSGVILRESRPTEAKSSFVALVQLAR